jgi:hypothetical protein
MIFFKMLANDSFHNTSSVYAIMRTFPAIHITILTLNCIRLQIAESPQIQKFIVLTRDREGLTLKHPTYENTSAYERNGI